MAIIPLQNNIMLFYMNAIRANNQEMLLQLAEEQPIAPEDIFEDDDIWEAAMRYKDVTVETHRTLFDIGLIKKTNMRYLDYCLSQTTSLRDEDHLEMLLHVMDHPTIASYRFEEYDKSNSIADLMCYAYRNDGPFTRIPELLEYVIDVIGVDPTIPGFRGVPLIYCAIQYGWVHLVEFLLEYGAVLVSNDVHISVIIMIDHYIYWQKTQNMATTIADMIELLVVHDYPFAEHAHELAAKLVDAGLPAIEPRLAPFAAIA